MAAASAGSDAYLELDKRWKLTCSLLFGSEVGGLDGFSEWLSERADRLFYSKSSLSGMEVAYGIGDYCPFSRRLSFEEVDFGRKFEPLAINDLKDTESIIQAVQERVHYTGNIVLGNSKFIEKSANVSDSFYVSCSSRVGDSKYIAYTSMARMCDHVFGTAAPGESSFLIRCNDTYHVKRAFELWMTANCTDCHYVFALNNCSECMFSFNLRGVRHAIGNAALPRDKYFSIKKSLQEQMRQELISKKKLPSLTELLGKASDHSQEARALLAGKLPPAQAEKTSMVPIEQAFSHTSKIVLGAELSGLESYRPYLTAHIRLGEKRKSVLTGKELFVGDYAKYFEVPKNRTVSEQEALKLVEVSPGLEGIEGISLENAHEYLPSIGYISLDFHDGTNSNIINCMAYAYSSNVLESAPCVQIKDSAYNLWPRSSDHLFGCGVLFDSSCCIHCYQSLKLSRCFEVDSSRDCSDCYFSHNIENCQSCMFCFNVKNLRYAIGNAEVGKEKFLQAKEALLKNIGDTLGKEHGLELDIFNLGCAKGP